jgi:hypothetical protein
LPRRWLGLAVGVGLVEAEAVAVAGAVVVAVTVGVAVKVAVAVGVMFAVAVAVAVGIALGGYTREASPPYDSDGGCDEQEKTKTIRSRDDSDARCGCLVIVRNSRLL